MRTSILLTILLGFISIPAFSQVPASAGTVHAQVEGIEVPTVANAPFTAKVVVSWNEPLIGGGTAAKKYFTVVARDSQGRVRRETRAFVPADSNAEPLVRTFTVLDPVSGTRTVCTTSTLVCSTGSFHPHFPMMNPGAPSSTSGKVTRESLGEDTIEGMPVVGTRETVANASGSHGGRRLALTRTELWYSPDLQMNLSVVRSNAQSGEVTLDVTDLRRGEPDPSLLSVPAGYEVNGARNNQ